MVNRLTLLMVIATLLLISCKLLTLCTVHPLHCYCVLDLLEWVPLTVFSLAELMSIVHFWRVAADNFSYTSVKKDFVKPIKHGMFTVYHLCYDLQHHTIPAHSNWKMPLTRYCTYISILLHRNTSRMYVTSVFKFECTFYSAEIAMTIRYEVAYSWKAV